MADDLFVNMLNKEVLDAEYIVGEEFHQSKNKHFHVVVIAATKIDIRSCQQCHFEFQGKSHRCRCTRVNASLDASKKKSVLTYIYLVVLRSNMCDVKKVKDTSLLVHFVYHHFACIIDDASLY